MIEKTWDMSPHRRKIFIDMIVFRFCSEDKKLKIVVYGNSRTIEPPLNRETTILARDAENSCANWWRGWQWIEIASRAGVAWVLGFGLMQ